MIPQFDLNKIKFSTDKVTFERAVSLYEKKKITEFKADAYGFSAVVLGTRPYRVYVHAKQHDRGMCECYLGQNDTLCKHMIAVALYAVAGGDEIKESEKEFIDTPMCSGKLGEFSKEELQEVKKEITSAIKYIKAYSGPSRTWFAYQNSLDEGCARLSTLVSKLPVSVQTAKLLVSLLLRLDKKLCTGGVDDSNGTVGGFMQETVLMLQEYTKLDPECVKTFKKLLNQNTCFGWEESLVKIFNEAQ